MVSQSPASKPYPLVLESDDKKDRHICLLSARPQTRDRTRAWPQAGLSFLLHTGAGAPLTLSEPPGCPYNKEWSVDSYLSEARLGGQSTRL